MSQPQGARNGIHGADGATFEQCYSRLQEVVQKLSAGNLTLQEALTAFEEGMSLAEKCQGMLDQAELRVKQVSARAARAGAEAIENLDARSRESAPLGQAGAIEVETVEQRVIIDTGPLAPPTAAKPPVGGPALSGRPPAQTQRPGTGPLAARPQTGPVPDNEDKYAEHLDLDPLFDDED